MMFIGHGQFARLQQVLQADQSHKLRTAILRHNGKACEPSGRHAIHHHAQRLFRKCHDWRFCNHLRQLNIPAIAALILNRSKEIIASHYPQQMLVAVNHRIDPLAARIVIMGQRRLQFSNRAFRREGGNVRPHHVFNGESFERIDYVLAGKMMAAPADFFRKDGPRHGQHGKGMRGNTGDQQRQYGVVIAGKLESKNDAR